MKTILYSLFLILTIGCNTCNHTSNNDKKNKEVHILTGNNTQINNITRLIAGLNQPEKSILKVYEKDTSWINYKVSQSIKWDEIEKTRLTLMQQWAKNELALPFSQSKTIFYPFSGPDFINVETFFQKSENILMIGLEPIGVLPNWEEKIDSQRTNYLIQVKSSLEDFFQKSYFITGKMIQNFKDNNLSGILPILSVFVVKAGYEIEKIDLLTIDSNSNEKTVDYSLIKTIAKPMGVRLFITNLSNGNKKQVTYFSADLSDQGLAKNVGFKSYLSKLPNNMVTYLKSASYLMHYDIFSYIRNICLNKSESILQDDSGIGYDFFDPNKWNIQLYGEYARPITDFPGIYEQSLEDAYTQSNIKKLPFVLGYQWRNKKVNMLRAIKK